jgi:hypothetical protein
VPYGTSSWDLLIQSRGQVIQDIPARHQHQLARTENISNGSRNLISSIQKPTAVNAVAEAPATGKMDCADVNTSPRNPAEDGFITMTEKKCDDVGAVQSSENNVTERKFRTSMYGVHNSPSLPVVFKRVKTKAFFVPRFSPEVTTRDTENSLKKQLKLSSIFFTKLKIKFNT